MPDDTAPPPVPPPSGPEPGLAPEPTVRQLLERYQPPVTVRTFGSVFTDTSDFMAIGYGDVIAVGGLHYLVLGDEAERRFGMEDPKFWVKRCLELESGSPRILKLEFYETFEQSIGELHIVCYRSAEKEARILDLVRGDARYMQGQSRHDRAGNLVRILDRVVGRRLDLVIEDLHADHREYFHELFPGVLENFIGSVRAIGHLHHHGEKHGDVRRDHIFVEHATGLWRWIDFDYGYDSTENPYGLDLFGLGNILMHLMGKGVHTTQTLAETPEGREALSRIGEEDCGLFFRNRVMNLRKLFPYIPEDLNRVLLHYSHGSDVYYETVPELLADLEPCLDTLRRL